MDTYHSYRRQSRKVALCGMMAALSVLALAGVGALPLTTFVCPMLAMACLVPVVCGYGTGTGLLLYAAVSLLALLLCPDREVALLYVFLGWYPGIRPRLARLPRLLGIAVKCALCSSSVTVMYVLVLYLFQMEAVAAEFAGYSNFMIAALLVMGNVVFLLFDKLLGRLERLWQRRQRSRQPV